MQRRAFMGLIGAVAWPLAARAQQPKVWRIGLLAPTPPTPAMSSALRDGLRERGYAGHDLKAVRLIADGGHARTCGPNSYSS
jgi:hypothetical protein